MKDTGWIAAAEFVRHPSMVGSAFPASARMVRRMLAPLDWSKIKALAISAQELAAQPTAFLPACLPFSTLGDAEAEIIMHETALALRPTGVLAAYQMRTAIRHLIDRNFAQVRRDLEWCNIPPCHLYWAASPFKAPKIAGLQVISSQ
ncbi:MULTISPECIES: hypothetical protein [unclassified Novosphingobium]|uniref:hypothetical protein n=1 Tax=unclassified Novosphingobium TaxID=2644732 RepID=UPI001F1F24C8|nr:MULTISPECIES: hypothetical protein [unclassified Novosphingobium]